MLITITQEDLSKANAVRNKEPLHTDCLLAVALRRHGYASATVGQSFIWGTHGHSSGIEIPDVLSRVIRSWERTGQATVPAEFEIPDLPKPRE